MTLEAKLKVIREKLEEGGKNFPNEAAVSQGIVLPILRELNWDTDDTRIVRPERSAGKGKVDGRADFTLCDKSGDPKVIIEVKKLGGVKGEGLAKLMQYAHSAHVPIVVLTDGRTWSFYLPGEGGLEYEKKRVSKPLDISDRSRLRESSEVLQRYLERNRVVLGEALETARVIFFLEKDRQAKPDIWREEVDDEIDKFVVPILSFLANRLVKKMESKSARDNIDHDTVDYFHSLLREKVSQSSNRSNRRQGSSTPTPTPIDSDSKEKKRKGEGGQSSRSGKLVILGEPFGYVDAKDAMVIVFKELERRQPGFCQRFHNDPRNHGRTRRIIAQNPRDLYDLEHLAKNHERIDDNWVIGTNNSNLQKEKIITIAAEVAGLKFGSDIIVNFDA